VVDALFQPAMLIDGAGRVQHANSAAVARFGLQEPLTCHGVLHGRAEKCPTAPWRTCARGARLRSASSTGKGRG